GPRHMHVLERHVFDVHELRPGQRLVERKLPHRVRGEAQLQTLWFGGVGYSIRPHGAGHTAKARPPGYCRDGADEAAARAISGHTNLLFSVYARGASVDKSHK